MKLPIPQELVDQLTTAQESMDKIIEGLSEIAGKLDELIELEKARD